MPALAADATWLELFAVLLVLVLLMFRDCLAGYATYLRYLFEGPTLAPPPGPARRRPLTSQHSCRQPARVIVLNHKIYKRAQMDVRRQIPTDALVMHVPWVPSRA